MLTHVNQRQIPENSQNFPSDGTNQISLIIQQCLFCLFYYESFFYITVASWLLFYVQLLVSFSCELIWNFVFLLNLYFFLSNIGLCLECKVFSNHFYECEKILMIRILLNADIFFFHIKPTVSWDVPLSVYFEPYEIYYY